MVAICHTCGIDLSDQDIVDVGMEDICHNCWEDRWEEINNKDKE